MTRITTALIALLAAGQAQAIDMDTRSANPADFDWGKNFGHSLQLADMDCNGVDDLVVGAPYKNVNGHPEAGQIYVIIDGSEDIDGQIVPVHQWNGSGPEDFDHFGWSMTVARRGNVNRNPHRECDVLFVGAPDEAYGGVPDAGAVTYIRGHEDFAAWPHMAVGTSFAKTTSARLPTLRPKANARFGHSMVITSSNPLEKLVVGAPGEDNSAGAVYVYPGGQAEWRFTDSWERRDRENLHEGAPQAGDKLGWSLASGLFKGASTQLAIGAPGWDAGGIGGSGAVIVTGHIDNEDSIPADVLVDPTPRNSGSLGVSVVAGDFDDDGDDELAVGGHFSSYGAGQVLVWEGSLNPYVFLSHNAPRRIRPYHAGSAVEAYDLFGQRLAAGDVDDDGIDDLAIGAPHEDRAGLQENGMVSVMFGSALGLDDWVALGPDRATAPQHGDYFGEALCADDGVLFVGMPGREWEAGLVVEVTGL